jgi:hypothetical protein
LSKVEWLHDHFRKSTAHLRDRQANISDPHTPCRRAPTKCVIRFFRRAYLQVRLAAI